jgi:tetrahydromethanopterin S-methyltransferase subunit F
MNAYRIFILCFCASTLALGVFLFSYIQSIAQIIQMADSLEGRPSEIFSLLFSPTWIIALLVMAIGSLAYRVLGIIFIARNPNLEGGEKAIWIIGFVILSFITAIVFMAMASSRNLLAKEAAAPQKY